MKKLATIIGLLSLMLVVTSFTTPNEVGGGKDTPSGPSIYRVGGGKDTPSGPNVGGGKDTPSGPNVGGGKDTPSGPN